MKSRLSLLLLLPQGGSSRRVGYFRAVQAKIDSDELFLDFLEKFKHVIPSRVHVGRVKDAST